MASFMVYPHADRALPDFQAQDVLYACNRERALTDYARNLICNLSDAPNNRDAQHDKDTHWHKFQIATREWQLIRVSRVAFEHVNQWTGERREITAGQEFDSLVRRLEKMRRAGHHSVFGTGDNIEAFGGRSRVVDVDIVWDMIETDTPNRRTDYEEWQFSEREHTGCLIVPCADFPTSRIAVIETELTRDVEEPDVDDPRKVVEFEETARSNAFAFNFAAEAGALGVTVGDILNRAKRVDIDRQNAVAIELKCEERETGALLRDIPTVEARTRPPKDIRQTAVKIVQLHNGSRSLETVRRAL